jgi:hypothetical protein
MPSLPPTAGQPQGTVSFPARFEALAASLNASYPPVRLHFQGEYISTSQNYAQQGPSLVLLNDHFTSLGSLEGIQDLSQFNIPVIASPTSNIGQPFS